MFDSLECEKNVAPLSPYVVLDFDGIEKRHGTARSHSAAFARDPFSILIRKSSSIPYSVNISYLSQLVNNALKISYVVYVFFINISRSTRKFKYSSKCVIKRTDSPKTTENPAITAPHHKKTKKMKTPILFQNPPSRLLAGI